MAEIARQTYDNHQVFIIAHPCAEGDPACTGCDWLYGDMQPGEGRLVEVWSGPWLGDTHNERALALWYEWLNQGHRIVATAGTDAHNMNDLTNGQAFNVVYAQALTEKAVLSALRKGHVYISAGPQLILTGRAGQGRQAMMGDMLPGEEAELLLEWADCPSGATIKVVAATGLVAEWSAGRQGSQTWMLNADQARWCVVELRNSEGQMLAFTNPIFLRSQSVTTNDSHSANSRGDEGDAKN